MNQKDLLIISMARVDTAQPLTVAYIAIGAHAASSVPLSKVDTFGGQSEFVELVCRRALLLDRVAVPFDSSAEHQGNYYYDVAEPFGKSYGYELLRSGNEALDPRPYLREVMVSAGYDAVKVDAALEAAEAANAEREVTFACAGWSVGPIVKGWYVQEPNGRCHIVGDDTCNNETERTFARFCAALSAHGVQ